METLARRLFKGKEGERKQLPPALEK